MLEVLIHDWLPLMILSGGGAAGCGKTNSSIDEDYKMSKGPAVHIKGNASKSTEQQVHPPIEIPPNPMSAKFRATLLMFRPFRNNQDINYNRCYLELNKLTNYYLLRIFLQTNYFNL